MFNLIEESWIPATTDEGNVVYVSPWEISRPDITLTDLAFERPDFNSAVYQFLIGLYQTVYTPKDDDEWLDRLEEPPCPEEMHTLMSYAVDKFELLGGWPRYMQDASVSSASDKGIMGLLITNPGENTVKLGKVRFVNANDGTCEGIDYPELKAFTVQFHPEACTGPKDTSFLFDQFVELMKGGRV